ncbi:DUF177 domain-containing protein [Microbacterium flavum]|uniref:DUF177 domain-containing protein n=2 Tax=Microbacterium flavum TaxID=415216 RepID=A0ABS5XW75_9MICO|nr:DUF177 domain-containing protein [Microbacterium flavum]MBT8798791.1 DUF177 domain-containing protein [Microbacterium flavum]
MREFEVEIPAPEKWGEGLVSIAEGEPVAVDVRLEAVHEGILVTADIRSRYTGVCGRCLTELAEPVEVEFQELFGYPGDEATDFEVQDDHVDLETPVRDSVVLSLPFQPVCQPDCPGLDPVTGDKLAEGTTLEPPIDDRWIALAALKADTPDHDDDALRDGVSHTEKS